MPRRYNTNIQLLSGTANFNVRSETDLDTGIGCGPGGDDPASGIVAPKVNGVYTCWLVLTAGSSAPNASDSLSIPVTYSTAPDPQVPEVPLNVLLPLSAAALIGGGMFISRRRRAIQA